jgi:hypothetical protein
MSYPFYSVIFFTYRNFKIEKGKSWKSSEDRVLVFVICFLLLDDIYLKETRKNFLQIRLKQMALKNVNKIVENVCDSGI